VDAAAESEPSLSATGTPTGQRPQNVRAALDLFLEVCDLPADERAAALDQKCGDDALLRAAVERMLAEDAPGGTSASVSAMGTGAGVRAVFDAASRRTPSRLERPPVLQGRYRIIRTIGEGGMGTVYEAEQVTPRRLVALKALRVGSADTEDALRRFALEAEVLARLQHPSIAHIHEAGFGDEIGEGPAWIAMELVRGKPLVTAVNERQLDRTARLKLFLQICDAVSFAHRRGVIHRDLKPSNILLAEPDPDATGDAAYGRPKVLDFGVARVLGDAWDAATVLTSPGQLVGTLSYMSPEQVSGDPDAVDVRTDVYALGVIFYELLTGKRPYEMRNKGLAEAITALRETEPPPLSSIDATLRGDLDAIGRRALAKEPRRRYQSVADFAQDIEKHLRGEPVAARADATFYVLLRQARRHRWPLSLATVIIVAIIALAVRSTIEAQRLSQLANAERASSQRAESARRALAAELDASQLEQARLLARGGSVASAEEVLSRRTGDSIEGGRDVPLAWTQREIAARHPRRVDWQVHEGDFISLDYSERTGVVVTGATDNCVAASDLDGRILATVDIATIPQWITVDDPNNVVFVGTAGGELLSYRLPFLELDATFPPFPRRVRDISILGPLLAYGGETGEVRVIDRDTGQIWTQSIGLYVSRLEFVNEGRLLVGRSDGLVMLLNYQTGERRALGRHGEGLSALAVDREGLRGYTSGGDRIVRVWDLVNSCELSSFDAMNGTPREVAFDRSNNTVLVSGWWTIDRWDPVTQARRRVGSHPNGNGNTLFRPEMNMAISGHSGGVARVWAIDDFSGGVRGPTMFGRSTCQFSPDGKRLAVADGFGMTAITDTATGAIRVRPPQHSERVKGLAFSPDGRYFASSGDDGKLWLSDASTGVPLALALGADPTSSLSLAFSPDGSRLAAVCRDRTVKLFALPGLNVVTTLPVSQQWQVISLAWSPDGTRLATTSREKLVKLWSVDGTLLTQAATGADTPWTVEFSPDGSMIAMGSWARWVELRDARDLRLIRTLNGAVGLVTRAGWIPTRAGESPLVYASAADGSVRVWDTTTGRVLFELDPFRSSDMTGCSISPDGTHLAVAGAWGECVTWDLTQWDLWSTRLLPGMRLADRPAR
jgi:serine/threonine protein kinase/WD40 repeat protein